MCVNKSLVVSLIGNTVTFMNLQNGTIRSYILIERMLRLIAFFILYVFYGLFSKCYKEC
jgi:hypothetical protein